MHSSERHTNVTPQRCPRCKKVKNIETTLLCDCCKKKLSDSSKKLRQSRRSKGLCGKCGKVFTDDEYYCNDCKSKHSEQGRKDYHSNGLKIRSRNTSHRRATKEEVISKYGGACICCGETQQEFLQMDHVNGLRSSKRPDHIYPLIKAQKFPTDFQILCANCNIGKESNIGICPKHKKYLGISSKIQPSSEDRLVRKRDINAYFKKQAFSYYGDCRCCGENELSLLSIDHVNDDGAQHRKNSHAGSGVGLYRLLIKSNFPEGFQTLCYNCNIGKRLNKGICPKHLINLNIEVNKPCIILPPFEYKILRGSDKPNSKLSWEKVESIRELHEQGASLQELAQQFEVSKSAIRNVIYNPNAWRKNEPQTAN